MQSWLRGYKKRALDTWQEENTEGKVVHKPEVWGEEWEWEPHLKTYSIPSGTCSWLEEKLIPVKLTRKWRVVCKRNGDYLVQVEYYYLDKGNELVQGWSEFIIPVAKDKVIVNKC